MATSKLLHTAEPRRLPSMQTPRQREPILTHQSAMRSLSQPWTSASSSTLPPQIHAPPRTWLQNNSTGKAQERRYRSRAGSQLRYLERVGEDARPLACRIKHKHKAYSSESASPEQRANSKSNSLSKFKSTSSLQSRSGSESSSSFQSRSRSSGEPRIRAHTGAQRQSTTDTERLDRRYSGTSVLSNVIDTSTINWYAMKHKEH
jgi:hypothetical protein